MACRGDEGHSALLGQRHLRRVTHRCNSISGHGRQVAAPKSTGCDRRRRRRERGRDVVHHASGHHGSPDVGAAANAVTGITSTADATSVTATTAATADGNVTRPPLRRQTGRGGSRLGRVHQKKGGQVIAAVSTSSVPVGVLGNGTMQHATEPAVRTVQLE